MKAKQYCHFKRDAKLLLLKEVKEVIETVISIARIDSSTTARKALQALISKPYDCLRTNLKRVYELPPNFFYIKNLIKTCLYQCLRPRRLLIKGTFSEVSQISRYSNMFCECRG